MKGRGSKAGTKKSKPHCLKKSSSKKPTHSRASGHQICTEGLFAEDAVVLDALDSLFARANGSSLESEIARIELRQIIWSLIDRLMNSAGGEGLDKGFADWAGGLLAEVLVVHEKSADWFSARSDAFKQRLSELRKHSHLLFKRANFSDEPSPLTVWLIRAHDSFIEAVSLGLLIEEIQKGSSDTSGLKKLSKARGFSGVPRADAFNIRTDALAVFSELGNLPPEEHEERLFTGFIWRWIEFNRDEIEREPWCELRKSKSGGYHQRSPSFANLKKDFRHLWKGYFKRPAGDLRGLERAG